MPLYKNGFEDTKQEALEDSVQQALGVETVGGAQFRRQRGGHHGEVSFLLFKLNAQFREN